MLSLVLAAAASAEPIHWVDLGLKNYLFKIGSFELRWYSLAYLAGIVLGYWHLLRMIKAPGAPLAQRQVDLPVFDRRNLHGQNRPSSGQESASRR